MTTPNLSTRKRRRWRTALTAGLVLLLLAGFLLFTPLNTHNLVSHPQPFSSYAEAIQRIEAINATETSGYNPLCQMQFMTHGQKVEKAIVMAHGYTSCPEQFRALGEQFYGLGYNVLIALLPHHGLANRHTDEQSQLTAEEVTAYADEIIDIAQSLGDHVTMMGLSGGAVTTAWAAQTRSDLDLAVIISPTFGYHIVPTPLTAAAMNYYLTVPNSYTWWDEDLKEKIGPDYAYPRYSTHALGQLLRVGFAVQVDAQRIAPAACSILVVTNANDTSVNNALTDMIASY